MKRVDIERLIPHSGVMCLLDTVLEWDDESIVCTTESHRRKDNPFIDYQEAENQEPEHQGLENGQLDSVVLVEYGAQAAAVHAGLTQQGLGGGGTAYLGAVKNLHIQEAAVDTAISTLYIEARCILNSTEGAIYHIHCGGNNRPLISARVVLILPA